MLCLDAKSTVIKLVKLSSGIPQEVRVDVRDVVDNALKYKAVSVVVAHNHPSGDVSPSVQDVELTRAIAAALQLIKSNLPTITYSAISDIARSLKTASADRFNKT